jgi:hypothetical protein
MEVPSRMKVGSWDPENIRKKYRREQTPVSMAVEDCVKLAE